LRFRKCQDAEEDKSGDADSHTLKLRRLEKERPRVYLETRKSTSHDRQKVVTLSTNITNNLSNNVVPNTLQCDRHNIIAVQLFMMYSIRQKVIMKYLSLIILSTALLFLTSCSSDEDPVVTPGGGSGSGGGSSVSADAVIWTGSDFTFTKEDGADPAQADNQDRITDKVAITRGNSGGEIYNAISENASVKDASPAGTEWAKGSLDNLDNLSFQPFRAAVGAPKDAVGENLVLHLIEDDIYLSVRFTAWSQGRMDGGGFAYVRSTP